MAYTIKSGDTMSSIASANNTTVESLMAANANNPSVKNKNLIIAGGNLNLPSVAAPTTPSTGSVTAPIVAATPTVTPPAAPAAPAPSTTPPVTQPPTSAVAGGAPGAVSPTSVPSDDWSAGVSTFASEMAGIGKSVQTLNEDYMQAQGAIQNPDGTWNYNPTPEEVAEHQQNLADIQANAARSKSDVGAAAATAETQAGKAEELLGLSPAAVKYKIDLFADQNNQLFKSISDAYDQITQDQNTATINEDYTYASQLQQEKLSLLQTQRQALSDQSSFMTNAFNILLGGKQEARLTQDDAITKVQNTYALGQIPSAADWAASGMSGTPPKVLPLAVWTPPVMQGGKLTQTNTQTGEVRVLSTTWFGSLDAGTQQGYSTQAAKGIESGMVVLSSITDQDERAMIISQLTKDGYIISPDGNTVTPPTGSSGGVLSTVGGYYNDIVNFFSGGSGGSGSSNASSTPSDTSSLDVSGDTSTIQAMGSDLASFPNPTP